MFDRSVLTGHDLTLEFHGLVDFPLHPAALLVRILTYDAEKPRAIGDALGDHVPDRSRIGAVDGNGHRTIVKAEVEQVVLVPRDKQVLVVLVVVVVEADEDSHLSHSCSHIGLSCLSSFISCISNSKKISG